MAPPNWAFSCRDAMAVVASLLVLMVAVHHPLAAAAPAAQSRRQHSGSAAAAWSYRALSCDTPANTSSKAGNFFSAAQLGIRNSAACPFAGPDAKAPGSCYSTPEDVWAQLKVLPAGSRSISLEGLGMYYLQRDDSAHTWYYRDKLEYQGVPTTYDGPWADTWQQAISARFDGWFAAYAVLGATVDFILSDFEMGGTSYWYAMSHQPADPSLPAGTTAQEVMMSDHRWPALQERLDARGKPFNVSFANVSDMASWSSTDMRAQVYDAVVVTDMVAEFLNSSVYQPIAKHFPSAKLSNFAHFHHSDPVTPPGAAAGAWWPWTLTSAASPVGRGSHVGTHQSTSFYGGTNNTGVLSTFDTQRMHQVTGSAFASLLQGVARAVDMVSGAPSVPVQPWFAPSGGSWNDGTSWLDGDGTPTEPSMWAENVFHVMLSTGATEALWWKPGAQRPETLGVDLMGAALAELRMALTDGADNCTTPTPLPPAHAITWDQAYVQSGATVQCPMAAGSVTTRTAVRFTPRCLAPEPPGSSACTQAHDAGAHPPAFKVMSGVSYSPIDDPGARLYEPSAPVSRAGYWVVLLSR